MRGFCARQWCFGYIAPSTAARRHVEGVRDARHDISLLTSRFRAADVNARYERSVGVTSCCLYKSLHLAFLLVPAALVVGQSMQHGVKPAVLLSHAERAFVLVHFALWLGRAAVAVAHLAGRAPRAALEGATVLEVLARIIAQVGVAIPIALAWHNDGLLITSQLSAAVATLEVAALTRYEQALPVAAAVVGTQLYTIARAPAGAAEYGQPAVMLVALVTLPLFVHIEVVKRSAWLQGELLTSLRQEVSHFGLNHLYLASSAIEHTLETADGAAGGGRTDVAEPLKAIGEMVEEVTKLLQIIVDDEHPSDLVLSEFNLNQFAALAFRGSTHELDPSADGQSARFASWAARSIIADVIAVARRHGRGAVRGTLALNTDAGGGGGGGAPCELVITVTAETAGVEHVDPTTATLLRKARQSSRYGGVSQPEDGSPHSPCRSQRVSLDVEAGAVELGAFPGPLHPPQRARDSTSAAGPAPRGSAGRRFLPAFASSTPLRALEGAVQLAERAGGRILCLQDDACLTTVYTLHLPADRVKLRTPFAASERRPDARTPSRLSSGGISERTSAALDPLRRGLSTATGGAHALWQWQRGLRSSDASPVQAARRGSMLAKDPPSPTRKAPSTEPMLSRFRSRALSQASDDSFKLTGGGHCSPIASTGVSVFSSLAELPAVEPAIAINFPSARRRDAIPVEAACAPPAGGGEPTSAGGGEPSSGHRIEGEAARAAHQAPPAPSSLELDGAAAAHEGVGARSPRFRFPSLGGAAVQPVLEAVRPAAGSEPHAAPAAAGEGAQTHAHTLLDVDSASPALRLRECTPTPVLPIALPAPAPTPPARLPLELAPMPSKHCGIERSRFRPLRADERAARILVVLDNNLDPPAWDGSTSGKQIARRLREMQLPGLTVVMHTGCAPTELAGLLASSDVDQVIAKDKAGREHVCNLCAQHDLCLFVDDMATVLSAIDLSLAKLLYGKVRAAEHAGGWAATANTHVRYAMFSRQAELDLLYAVCARELVFDDNLLLWHSK